MFFQSSVSFPPHNNYNKRAPQHEAASGLTCAVGCRLHIIHMRLFVIKNLTRRSCGAPCAYRHRHYSPAVCWGNRALDIGSRIVVVYSYEINRQDRKRVACSSNSDLRVKESGCCCCCFRFGERHVIRQ